MPELGFYHPIVIHFAIGLLFAAISDGLVRFLSPGSPGEAIQIDSSGVHVPSGGSVERAA